MAKTILFCLWIVILYEASSISLSNPHKADSQIADAVPGYLGSKTLSKSFFNHTKITPPKRPIDVTHPSYESCNINIKPLWITPVTSAVLSSPIIIPSTSSTRLGRQEILLTTFYEGIERITSEGFKGPGWPLQLEGSSFQGHPILFDLDRDGFSDIGVADTDANIFWIRIGEVGEYLEDYHMKVPHLKVKKGWFEGLDPSFVDRYASFSMFDTEGTGLSEQPPQPAVPSNKVKLDDLFIHVKQESYPHLNEKQGDRRLLEEGESEFSAEGGEQALEELNEMEFESENQEINEEEEAVDVSSFELPAEDALHEPLVPLEHEVLSEWKDLESQGGDGSEETSQEFIPNFGEEGLPLEEAADDYNPLPAPGVGYRTFDDGAHYGYGMGTLEESDVVYIDPHVLGTPVLIPPVDGRGGRLILAVSYYFDKQPAAEGVQGDMYVAGGVVCWDLDKQAWSWLVHLDLTTDHTLFKAYIHSSPTIVDLDNDGRYEILVGTSMGLLYCLDSDTGFVRRHFPLQFHSIEAQVAVGRVKRTESDQIQIIVGDMAGNVVLLTPEGDILWDIQVAGSCPFAASLGDVTGDGNIDVVIVAISETTETDNTHRNVTRVVRHSFVYAVDGSTGILHEGYPVALPRGVTVSAPLTLAELHPDHEKDISKKNKKKSRGLDIVVPTFEGHVYILNKPETGTACAQRIDVGEHIAAPVLLHDLDHNGYLDLVVSTVHGQVYAIETSTRASARNIWTSFPNHRLNMFAHGSVAGIGISSEAKKSLRYSEIEVSSDKPTISFNFEIWDQMFVKSQDSVDDLSYHVRVMHGKEELFRQSYSAPGTYSAQIIVTPPQTFSLTLSMKTRHGLYVEDTAVVSVAGRFYVYLKYLPTVPVMLLCVPLLLMSSRKRLIN